MMPAVGKIFKLRRHTLFVVRPIEKFPDVQPGLDAEIRRLYESSRDAHGFPRYFRRKAAALRLSRRQAGELDGLVEQIYATLETINSVESRGGHRAARPIAFNALDNAANGVYNDSGWVHSEVVRGEGTGDHNAILLLAAGLRAPIDAGVEILEGGAEIAGEIDPGKLKEEVLDALQKKLRFESAIYYGMKKIYGVTPSRLLSSDKSRVA